MFEYNPQTDFSEDEADLVSGRSSVQTAALDAEHSNIARAITGLISALTAIQRQDGALLDGIVTLASLASDVLAIIVSGAFHVRGPWVTVTLYAVGDVVSRPTGTYLCVITHTSGTFSVDLAAGDWTAIFDASALSASLVSFTPTGTIASANTQAAIAEVAAEALQVSQNLNDVASKITARSNLSVFSKAEIQANTSSYALNTGTSDALIGAYVPVIAALTNGMTLEIEATGANTITAPTFDAGTGAFTIKKQGATPLAPGDIPGAGSRAFLSWHTTGTYWELLNPAGNVSGLAGTDIASLAGGVAALSTFGDEFNITVAGSVTSISSRPRGTRITFNTVVGNTFVHDAASILMRHAVTSTLLAGEIIEFISLGGAIWSEASRRDLPSRERVAIRLSLSQLAR